PVNHKSAHGHAVIEHFLEGICELDFASSGDVFLHDFFQCIKELFGLSDVVNADDGKICGRVLGLFHEAFHLELGVEFNDTKAATVFDLVNTQGRLGIVENLSQISLKNGITQYDEYRFVSLMMRSCQPYGMA